MSINSNAFINRIEIFFYSILITLMSGINRIRSLLYRPEQLQSQPVAGEEISANLPVETTKQKSVDFSWSMFSQTLVAILIWSVLGFAAGFLFGMINPR